MLDSDFLTRNSRRQLQEYQVVPHEQVLRWENALLFLEEDEEQYIEKSSDCVATLHHHPTMSEAAFISLVKPWLKKATDNYEPYHPVKKVVQFVKDLTGPQSVKRESRVDGFGNVVLQYGDGLELEVVPLTRDGGVETPSSFGWALGSRRRWIKVASLEPGWQSDVAETLQRFKSRVLFSEARNPQEESVAEAARRTDRFEAIRQGFHDFTKVVGFRDLVKDRKIGLNYEKGDSSPGLWSSKYEMISLNVNKLADPHVPIEIEDEVSKEEALRKKALSTTLHELGHAACEHSGSSAGHSYESGYDFRHELQAEDYVMKHAQSELEGELFESWAYRNLKYKRVFQ